MQHCTIICRDAELLTVPPEPKPIDLFEYCKDGYKSMWYPKNHLIRFDTTIYPVPKEIGDSFATGSSGYKLITDLLFICHRDGSSTYCSNGSYNLKTDRKSVV